MHLDKIFIKNISTGKEEELIISDEKICVPGISLTQRDRNTDNVLSWIFIAQNTFQEYTFTIY